MANNDDLITKQMQISSVIQTVSDVSKVKPAEVTEEEREKRAKRAKQESEIRTQKEKEAEQAELLKKQKEEKIKESQKIPRYWNGQSADRYHLLSKKIVKKYYTENNYLINENAWFAERGEPIIDDEEIEEKKETKNQETDEINPLPAGEKQKKITPKNKIDQKYTNDYTCELESKYGSIQVKSDNWEDPNCWHRKMWEYITAHPICPGKDVNGDDDPNDPYYKKDFVKSAGLEKELKAVENDVNTKFLTGQQLDTFKSEADLEMERSYKQAMTSASSDWQQYQNERLGLTFGQQADYITVQQNLQDISHGLNNSLVMIDQIITPKLTTYITTYMNDVIMSYTQQAIVDILSFDAREIVEMGMKLVPDYIKTPSEILKELLADNESITNSEVEKSEENLRNKFNDKLSYYAGKISDFGLKELQKVNKELCMISYYSQMGPAWINDKVEKAVSTSTEFSLKYIGIARNKAIEERTKFVEKMSRELAHRVAVQECKKIEVLQKRGLDEANQKKTEALSKAKTQIQQAKLIIFGLLGA